MLDARNEDFLPADDVVVAVAHRARLDPRRVGAAGRLGHAEGLQAQLARRDVGQVPAFLRLAAVAQQGAHDVHLRVAGGAVGAAALDFLEHRAGRAEIHAGAAVFLRYQYRQVARLGQ